MAECVETSLGKSSARLRDCLTPCPADLLNFDGALKLDSWLPTLAFRTFPLEDIAPIGAIDIAAGWLQAMHAVSPLQVIISATSAMPAATLVVAIDVADLR